MPTSITRRSTETASNAVPSLEARDSIDRINANITAVMAICDAVKVLSALERSPDMHDGTNTGDGMASGYGVADATMPNLLFHASMLAGDVMKDADVLWKATKDQANVVASANGRA